VPDGTLRRFAAAALVAAACAAAAADDSAGARYYSMRLGKVSKTAAARLWEAADRARRDSLFKFAREEARRALELDPDNLAARQFLGYVKKGETWEIDLAQSGKLPTENVATAGAAKLADAENAWRTSVAPKADLDVAALYAALGDECAAKGYHAEAETAWRLALGLDRDSAAAHKGLGDVKFADGLWLSAEATRDLAASSVVRAIDEPSRWDDLFGEKFAKAESAHFRVESPHPPEALQGYLGSCERAYATYLADLGVAAPVFPRKPAFFVVQTSGQWDRWINRMSRANPGFSRGLGCHWPRDQWVCALNNQDGTTDATRRDRLAHQTAHMMSLALWGMPDGCWLDDALAYRCAVLAQGTTGAYCLAPKKEDYARSGAQKNWTDQSQWKALLKDAVTAKDDLPLRAVVTKSSYELPLYASVKAWSVVDFLVRRDRNAFVGMLKALKDEKDLVALVETQFGKDVETLDDQWHRWVLETY
jgi:tetratricopeptide (TPR) repeat protein